jgi:hypothetical protein
MDFKDSFHRVHLRLHRRARRQNAACDDVLRPTKTQQTDRLRRRRRSSHRNLAIGVGAGSIVSQYVSEKTLQYVAGIGFIAIGIWTLVKA